METEHDEVGVSQVAAVIAEPARIRMLYCLIDGEARTSTELALVAGISPSTASVHLCRLREYGLVKVLAQGRLRYYSIENCQVAATLEALTVCAGNPSEDFLPNAASLLRTARTCYDHLAGVLGVALHDRFQELGWLSIAPSIGVYELMERGRQALGDLGIEVETIKLSRRRFACACHDWSERRPHMGGALGAALLKLTLQNGWVAQDLNSRALSVTGVGQREFRARFGVQI